MFDVSIQDPMPAPLTDCIWEAPLEFARGLLTNVAHRRESISTVAHRAGFSDVAHFSRRFKRLACHPASTGPP